MQRPTFTATAVMESRRDPDKGQMELNLVDAKGNTQNLILDNVAVGHVLAAILQKASGNEAPLFYFNESIPLHSLVPFRLPDHVGLRMFINPTSVIDFVFDPQHVATLQSLLEPLAAQIAAQPAPAPN